MSTPAQSGVQITIDDIVRTTRALAGEAIPRLSAGDPGRRIARIRKSRPVDYMRMAEFKAVLADLNLDSGMRVLDASSPQFFTLALARLRPDVQFEYINITDDEVAPYRSIAELCGVKNLTYRLDDLRKLSSQSAVYDRVISISVIEHVAPAEGGDDAALAEIRRVLKPCGRFHITVPFKDKARVVCRQGPVYERDASGPNFFSRNYDASTWRALMDRMGWTIESESYISEAPGPFALDYIEYGPSSAPALWKMALRSRRVVERVMHWSPEAFLARRNLRVTRDPRPRLANLSAALNPGR